MAAIAASDKTGIDVPFGWPENFVRAISEYSGIGLWPDSVPQPSAAPKLLQFRETDRFVRVFGLDQRQRVFETQGVRAVGVSPTRGRNHGRAGPEGQQRKAFEGAGGLAVLDLEQANDPVG